MYAVISPEKIEIPPGALFQIPGSSDNYQTLSQKLGDRSIPRLKYRPGEITISREKSRRSSQRGEKFCCLAK
jgi:hypothetical protein